MLRPFNPFAPLDHRRVASVLAARGSRDPDEVDLTRARFGRWVRLPRLTGTALILAGAAAAVGAHALWPALLPVGLGWWLWRRSVSNRAALEAAIAAFTSTTRR